MLIFYRVKNCIADLRDDALDLASGEAGSELRTRWGLFGVAEDLAAGIEGDGVAALQG